MRGEERCTMCEKEIIDLEEELRLEKIIHQSLILAILHLLYRVVGQNLQQLEVSEEKALAREESYQNQIKNLTDSLKVGNVLLYSLKKQRPVGTFKAIFQLEAQSRYFVWLCYFA